MDAPKLNETDRKILKIIRQNPDNSKQIRIAELAGMPWSSTKVSISKLQKYNFVTIEKKKDSNDQQSDSSEKKGIHLNSRFGWLIGVSLGKNEVRFCIMDFSYALVKKQDFMRQVDYLSRFRHAFWDEFAFKLVDKEYAIWKAKTPSDGLIAIKKLMNDLCLLALELNQKVPILAITFAVGDQVDDANSVIVRSNLVKDSPMYNVGVYALLTSDILHRMKDSGIDIRFEQNAKAAAIAERYVGCLKNCDESNGIVLYFGRGIGAAFWFSGLYRGSSNAAGSAIGHFKVAYEDGQDLQTCSCGAKGCLEQMIREQFHDEEQPDFDINKMSGAELAEWLDDDKHKAQKEALVKYLSRAIFNICGLLEIQFICFSGRLGAMYKSIELSFQEKMIQYGYAGLRILSSNLGENASAVGAALSGYFKWINEPIE